MVSAVKVPTIFSVPEPDKTPCRITPALVLLPTVGLLPIGRVQSDPTVLLPAVCVKVTRLNVLLPQLSVTPEVPLIFTVPPLASKVAALFMVNAPPKLAVPLGAVNDPPEFRLKAPLTEKVE